MPAMEIEEKRASPAFCPRVCDHVHMNAPQDFSALALDPALAQGLDALGYTTMTPVQAQALPAILDGRDVIAQAPTGSGKTAAFGLGLLHRIDAGAVRTQALVLCPTRELADQVGKQLRKLATGIPNLKISILCGGIPLGPQLASLAHEPQVVVGTPGRIQELVQKQALSLSGVRTLVLDEADRMLDMGFEDAIRDLVKRTPKDRQGLLFSATFPDAIRALGSAMLRDAVEVSVDGGAEPSTIEQLFFEVEPERKAPLLAALLLNYKPASCVVFCTTVSPHWRCTATWNSATARKRWCVSRIAAAACWSPATWPRAAWTSRISLRSSTTTCPATPTPTCTASAAPAAPVARVWR